MSKIIDVPENTITGKDLDYLSDMFQWNYGAYKSTCSAMVNVNDQKISELLGEAKNFFDDNLNFVLDIINNPGGEIDE